MLDVTVLCQMVFSICVLNKIVSGLCNSELNPAFEKQLMLSIVGEYDGDMCTSRTWCHSQKHSLVDRQPFSLCI